MFVCISEGYSQTCCPSGLYSVDSVTSVHPISGCTYKVYYCYYDAPGGDRKLFICSINVDATQSYPPCDFSSFTLDSDFWDEVEDVVLNDLHDKDGFDPCGEGGGQSNMIVESSKAKCHRLNYNIALDLYIVEACDDEPGLCVSIYSICVDDNELVRTDISGPTLTGSGSCGNIDPDINSNETRCFNTCN